MEIKSTLKVFNQSEVKGAQGGVGQGQWVKHLAGDMEHPTERLTISLISFEPGMHEKLHWHPIEVFYYVISGLGVMVDIEGNSRELRPGSVVYAPPGIAGSHSWDIKERLQLIGVRATTDPEKTLQFDVDPLTKESSIPIERLVKRDAMSFKRSHY